MPKITEYGASKVETQVTKGARARNYDLAGPGDFSGALNTVAKTVDQIGQKADKAAAEEALNNFEKEKNDLFFNPDSGYFNLQGRTAYEKAGEYSSSLEDLKKKYASNLSSPRARDAFAQAADTHITRSNADIMKYAGEQVRAWETATTKARVENAVESASLHWNDPDKLKLNNAIGRQAVIDAAELEGIDGEALNERLETFDSSFAKATISAAMSQSADKGREAMEEYGSLVEGEDRLKLQGLIQEKDRAEKVVSISSQLVAQHGDATDARARISEEIAKIDDPDLRKEAGKEATRLLDERMEAQEEERAAIFEDAENYVMQTGASAVQWRAENPEAWEKLSPKMKRTLESGEQVVTDQVLLSELLLKPPRELARVQPAQYFGDLAPADRQRLTSAVKSAREGGTDHQVARTRTAQTQAVIRDLIGSRPTGGYKGDDLKRVNTFYNLIDDEVRFREQQNDGAPLTSQEYTDILNGMARKVVTDKGILWDTEEDITSIPTEHLDTLSDHLHRNGIPVTAENLLNAYKQASQ